MSNLKLIVFLVSLGANKPGKVRLLIQQIWQRPTLILAFIGLGFFFFFFFLFNALPYHIFWKFDTRLPALIKKLKKYDLWFCDFFSFFFLCIFEVLISYDIVIYFCYNVTMLHLICAVCFYQFLRTFKFLKSASSVWSFLHVFYSQVPF